MNIKATLWLFAAAITASASGQDNESSQNESFFDESFPREIAQKYMEQNAAVEALPPGILGYLGSMQKRWTPGTVVRVAFMGGSYELHKKISEVAFEWTRHGNLKFDFGHDPKKKLFRNWSPNDKVYHAEIRIAFDLPNGCWSALGTDSVNPKMFAPSSRSMNLDGFLQRKLPNGWEGIVLHEFGHVLGFSHEHQQAKCRDEIRWERGPNGEPSVYDVLWEEVGWDREKVDFNLKTFVPVKGDIVSLHDNESNLHYSLPSRIFYKGKKSPCYVGKNNKLSAGDKAGMARMYPYSDTGKSRVLVSQEIERIKEQKNVFGFFGNKKKSTLAGQVAAAQQAIKPRVFFFIADENQREIADKISEASNAEFVPLRVANLGRKWKPSMIEVRYLRYPQDKPVAEAMLKIMKEQFGIENARISYTERSPKAEKPGDIEVWFSKSVKFAE